MTAKSLRINFRKALDMMAVETPILRIMEFSDGEYIVTIRRDRP